MEQKQRFINLAQSGRFTVSELSEEFGITRKMIFPRKRVEGLFGYSGLWFRGDSKSSGDL
jgi:hypothetical protein